MCSATPTTPARARNGGVLLMAGDDHACKSSTVPHQSEPALIAASMPVLVPADVRDLLELGLHGWAMSRWSGRYVGFKTVADVVDTSAQRRVRPRDHFRSGCRTARIPTCTSACPISRWSRRRASSRSACRRPSNTRGRTGSIGSARSAAGRAVRHHHGGKVLSRHAAGAGRSRRARRHPAAEARADLAGRSARSSAVSPRVCEEIVVIEEKSPFIEQQLRDILYDVAGSPARARQARRGGRAVPEADGEFSSAEIALALGRRIAAVRDTTSARAPRLPGRAGAHTWRRSKSRRSGGRISVPAVRTTPRPR